MISRLYRCVFRPVLLGLLAGSLMVPATVFAQLEEIVVTTRKRDEALQDVPVAVNVLDLAAIERRNVHNLPGVTKLDSSLIFDLGIAEQDTRVAVRGLSPTRGRQNIATLIDGIDVSSEAVETGGGSLLINTRLMDIERIEIVKGPQTALYGRSAFNGAIQYITQDSADDFEGQIMVDVNEKNRYSVAGSISAPLIDNVLGFRLNAAWWDEDGYYENQISGDELGSTEGWGTALTLNLTPTDELSFKARVEYTDDEISQAPQAWLGFNASLPQPQAALDPVAGPPAGPPVLGCHEDLEDASGNTGVFCDFPQPAFAGTATDASALEDVIRLQPDPRTDNDFEGTDRDVLRLSLVAELDVGTGTFTSLTGFTDAESTQTGDFTNFAEPDPSGQLNSLASRFSMLNIHRETEQFSQEFRFSTNFEGAVQATLGALYWDETVEQQDRNMTIIGAGVSCPTIAACPGFSEVPVEPVIADAIIARGDGNPVNRDTEHWSIYGLVEMDITDQWSLTFEGRYNSEDEETLGPKLLNDSQAPGTLILCGPLVSETELFVECDESAYDGPFMFPPMFESEEAAGLSQGYVNIIARTKSDWFTPKVTLQWDAAQNAMLYTYYAKSEKPGGISTLTTGSGGLDEEINRFDPEEMDVYEFGAKTEWFDQTLRINTALFFQDFTNKQVNTVVVLDNGNTTQKTLNAGQAEIWGFELDVTWAPAGPFLGGQWTLSGAYTLLDAKYIKFEQVSSAAFAIARNGACDPFFNPVENQSFCNINSNGRDLENAPDNSFVGTVSYVAGLFDTGIDWFIETDVIFQDERAADFSNLTTLDSFWNTDLRLGLQEEKWEVILYVDNVFDDDTMRSVLAEAPGLGCCFLIGAGTGAQGFTVGVDVPSVSLALLPEPRNAGVRAVLRF